MFGPAFDGLAQAHVRAGHSTANILTGMYRGYARELGVPRAEAKHLRVSFDSATLGFDYHLPERLKTLEYGDESHPPVAFRRRAMAAHSKRAERLFDRMAALHHQPQVL